MKLTNIVLALAAGVLLSACGNSIGGDDASQAPDPGTPLPSLPRAGTQPVVSSPVAYNDVPVHDPSVVRAHDGTFYVIGSHLAMAKSSDLVTWESIADGVTDANPLFDTYAAEIAEGIAWTGGYVGSWASDIIRLADGRYYFYYDHCATADDGLCDAPRSYLGVAVADSIEGPYTDLGIFLWSGQSDAEIAGGYGVGDITSFDGNVMPNVIDPDVFYDKEGLLWMTYGSYSGGIFILRMDDTTGKPVPDQGYGKHLAGGFFSAIEGSSVLYSPETDYYYLFTSFGGFEAGDGYNIRVARSRNPDGPYVDAEGNDIANAAGGWDAIAPFGVKVMAGFEFSSDVGGDGATRGYLSPGHNSTYYDEDTGRHLLIMHTRFPNRGEEHAIRVHEMFVNSDDWLVVSPHRYAPMSGDNFVGADDLPGDYRFVNLEKDIDREAKRNVYMTLQPDRTITGNITGSYVLSGSERNIVTLYLNGLGEYHGAMRWQWDMMTEQLVPTIAALSPEGAEIWASRMPDLGTDTVLENVSAALALPENFQGDSIGLPTHGTRGAQISWSSDNTSVIKTDGTVIRPNVGDGDQTVGLTATITLNGEQTSVSYFVTVPERSPFNRIAQWDFENNLGDSLGNYSAGIATGDRLWKTDLGTAAYAAGHDGQALSLDGTSGVRLPDGLIGNYEYSVSMWMNPTTITAFTAAFFGSVNELSDGGDPYSNSWISLLPESWDGNTMLWSGSDPWFDGSAGERIPEATWSHVGFSVNRGLVKVFINGVERFSAGNLTDFFTDNAGQFALGVNYWDLPYNGVIDELKVYDAALTAGEMKALDVDYTPSTELLDQAADLLDLGDLSAVKADLHLPLTGPFAAAIAWMSSDPEHISVEADTGVVARPGKNDPAAEVTLTATLTLDGESTTKVFTATVSNLAPPAPTAVYRFEGDLADSTANHAAGTLTGGLIATIGGTLAFDEGIVGQALVLDGSTGVQLPQNLVTDSTYAISLWMNPAALNGYTTALFGGSTTSWISVVPAGLGDAGTTMLWSGEAWYDAVTGMQIATGEWAHFVAVNNDGDITVYLDGELMFSGTNYPDVFTPLLNPRFWIGVNYWDPAYTGMIDELKFFDEALQADDVAGLYLEGGG